MYHKNIPQLGGLAGILGGLLSILWLGVLAAGALPHVATARISGRCSLWGSPSCQWVSLPSE